MSDDEKRAYNDQLRRFLRETGNAICLHTTDPVVWWIKSTWSDESSGQETTPAIVMTQAEKKLRPNEVGEDRKPEPVMIRHVNTDKNTDRFAGVHPRWYAELASALRLAKKDGLLQRVMEYVAVCETDFLSSEVANSIKTSQRTNIGTTLASLCDAKLLTCVQARRSIGSGSTESRWSTIPTQRHALESIILFSLESDPIDWCKLADDESLYNLISLTEGEISIADLAPRAFMIRGRLYAVLRRLAKQHRISKLLRGNVVVLSRNPIVDNDKEAKETTPTEKKVSAGQQPVSTNHDATRTELVPIAPSISVDDGNLVESFNEVFNMLVRKKMTELNVEFIKELDAARSRCVTLENEYKTMRATLAYVTSENDAMSKRLANMRKLVAE
jgi:hypothetical protein